jgi:hypothetical protein
MSEDKRIPGIPMIPNSTRFLIFQNQPNGNNPQIPIVSDRINVNIPSEHLKIPAIIRTQATGVPIIPTVPTSFNRLPSIQEPVPAFVIPKIPNVKDYGKKKPISTVNIPVIPGIREPVKNHEIKHNPYLLLSDSIIDSIGRERDIQLQGKKDVKAMQLYLYDEIMPDWIESIYNKTVDNFQLLSGSKLHLFAALNGISCNDIGGNSRTIINYIRLNLLHFKEQKDTNIKTQLLRAVVDQLDRNILEKFVEKIGLTRYDVRFIKDEDLKLIAISGNANSVNRNELKIISDRYTILTQNPKSDLISRLYGGIDIIEIARMEPHPMESVILNIDKYTVETLVSAYKIVVPVSHIIDPKRYVIENLVDYANIFTRGNIDIVPVDVLIHGERLDIEQYLSKLTDQEIFSTMGIYVQFASRLDLIDKIIAAMTRPRFMIPTVRSLERSINKQTCALTEIIDTTVFMVCYGTINKYATYELSCLNDAFYKDETTQMILFRHPENPQITFTTEDIEILLGLLKSYGNQTPEMIELIKTINSVILNMKDAIAFDGVARNYLNKFGSETKMLIRDFLNLTFYCGMYMRRWDGKGPFPLKSETTNKKELPDIKVSEELMNGKNLLMKMGSNASNYCRNLRLCEYRNDGKIDSGDATFGRYWDNVCNGNECIRMASSKFIGTGYHFLRVLFGEIIPGVDTARIDRIT